MRSRTKTTATKEEATPALVPKLRFPEFRGTEEWDQTPLGTLMEITSSKRVHQSDWTNSGVPFYRAREIVALNNMEPISPLYISEDLYRENAKRSGEIAEGDLLVTGVGSIGVPYLVKACDRFYFKDGNIIWLKNRRTKLLGPFLFLLYGTRLVQSQINTMAGVGTVGTYTIDNANRTIVAFPHDEAEQQKIAECLSSMDELIAAQARKVDALKINKKGLMQQLFPREGETQPRLRFPEFQNAGEWELTTVGSLVGARCLYPPKDGNHGNIHPKSSDYVAKGIPFIMASDLNGGLIDIENCHFISKEQADKLQKGFAKEGDVLLSHKGTVGEVAVVRKINTPYLMLTPQVTYYRVKDPKKLSNEFLAQLFLSGTFQSNLLVASGGGTRAYIGITEQAKLGLQLPRDVAEQQRIARCLSSLDALITAETQKLEALKTHKKGLMQQLFPSPEEVEA